MAGDLRHIKLWKQLEEKAKEATKTRKLSEETIEAAEKLIKEAKNIDANVAEVEAVLTEATAALSDKDYKLAFEKGSECREKALRVYRERIRNILDSNKHLLDLVKRVKGDTSGEESSIKLAEEAFQKEDFIKAVDLAKDSWKRSEKTLHEELSRMFSTAQSLILTAKKSGKDVKMAEDILSRAREAMDGSDYELAINSTKECLDSVGSALNEEIQLNIEEVKALIELAREVDFDVKRLENSLQKVQSELDKYSYDSAMSYAKQTRADSERILKSAISSKLASFPAKVREAEKINADVASVKKMLEDARIALKDGDMHRSISQIKEVEENIENSKFEIVLENISLLRHKFVKASNAGADIEKPLELLNKARDVLKDGNFEDALELAERSEREIDDVLKDYKEAESELKSVQRSFALGDIIGIDTKGYRTEIERAQKALRDKDFDKYAEIVKKTKEEIEKALSQKTDENVERSQFYIGMGEKMGLELAEVKDILKNSISRAEAKEYTEAVSISKEVRAKTEAKLKEHITNSLTNLKETIAAPILKKEDVEAFNQLIKSAEVSLGAGEYEKAYKHTQEGAEKLGHKLFSELKNLMFAVENAVNVARELNIGVDQYYENLSLGKKALEDKNYKEVLPLVVEVSNSLATQTGQVFSDLKEKLIKLRKMKIDVRDFLSSLKEAAAFKKEGNLLATYQKLHECHKRIETILEMRKKAYEIISSCAILIAEAKKKDIDAQAAVTKLMEAKKLYQTHAYAGSIKMAEEIKDNIKKETDHFTASERIEEVNTIIQVATELDIDIEKAHSTLEQAIEALKNGNFSSSIELSDNADNAITEVIRNELSTMHTSLQTNITEAKDVGINVEIAEEHFTKSKGHFEKNELKDSTYSAISAKEELKRLKDLSKKAASTIKQAQDLINDTETMNIQVPKQRKLLEESMKLLDKHIYETAIEYSEKALFEVDKERNNVISKTIVKFKEAIKKAKKEGINTSSSEKIIDKAVKAFKNKKHKDALELAMRSEKEMERVGLQQDMAQKALSTAKRKIDSIQFPTPRAESLLKKGKEAYKNGDYIKALEYAIQTGDEAYKVMVLYDDTMDKLGSASKLMQLAYKIGIKVQKEEESMRKANTSLGSGDLEVANQMSEKTLSKTKSSIADQLNILTIQLEELENFAKNMGLETAQYTQMIVEIRGSLEEENFEHANNMLELGQEELEKIFTTEFNSMIEDTRTMIAHANKMGADTSQSEKLLEEASDALSNKEFEKAAELIAESEESLETKEMSDKKFMDITYEAETILSTMKKYGIEAKNVENVLNEAMELKDEDLEKAMVVAEKSLELAKKAKGEYVPVIEASISIKEPMLNEWVEAELTLNNKGKALAKNIVIDILGDAEIEEIEPVKILKVGGKMKVSIKIKLTSSGSVPLAIKLRANRILDDTVYEFEQLEDIEVPSESKPEKNSEGKKVKRQRVL